MLASLAILVPIMIAQGGVVFLTARLVRHWLGGTRWWSKAATMIVSWFAWMAFTIGGYLFIGGSGGLMEGMGMILILCILATVASMIYLICWLLAAPRQTANEG